MIKKTLFILLFALSSCGYQPLYSTKTSKDLIFKKIELTGNKKVNRRVISLMNIKENSNKFFYEELVLKNSKKIIETSKNSKGQPDSFKMIINISVKIEDKDGSTKQHQLSKEFGYKNLENKFNLTEYEDNLQNNLIDEIVEELVLLINL